MNPPSTETQIKTCVDCQLDFTLPRWGLEGYEIRCEGCITKSDVAAAAAVLAAKEAKWLALCPKAFHDTDPSKLPCPQAYRTVIGWRKNFRGLILHGPTRTGKSRCAWLLLKHLHSEGNSVGVMNRLSGLEYAAAFSRSCDEVEKWAQLRINCDVLLMDDVFKTKLTDSYEGVVFSIVDQRTQENRPIILASNDTGDSLAGRMSLDRSGPLVARLREFCSSIIFTP